MKSILKVFSIALPAVFTVVTLTAIDEFLVELASSAGVTLAIMQNFPLKIRMRHPADYGLKSKNLVVLTNQITFITVLNVGLTKLRFIIKNTSYRPLANENCQTANRRDI